MEDTFSSVMDTNAKSSIKLTLSEKLDEINEKSLNKLKDINNNEPGTTEIGWYPWKPPENIPQTCSKFADDETEAIDHPIWKER